MEYLDEENNLIPFVSEDSSRIKFRIPDSGCNPYLTFASIINAGLKGMKENYKLVPQLTIAGYSIMIREISKQTNQYITHIFLQAGVGGMAAGVVAGVAKYFKRIPKIIIVEPDRADCVLQSIKHNKLKKIKIKKESIMGGMSCNEMSYIPWQILKKTSNCCVSVSDRNIAKTVAMLKDKKLSKNSIICLLYTSDAADE